MCRQQRIDLFQFLVISHGGVAHNFRCWVYENTIYIQFFCILFVPLPLQEKVGTSFSVVKGRDMDEDWNCPRKNTQLKGSYLIPVWCQFRFDRMVFTGSVFWIWVILKHLQPYFPVIYGFYVVDLIELRTSLVFYGLRLVDLIWFRSSLVFFALF